MTNKAGAALEALYLHWKNPVRYLEPDEISNIGLMSDGEYADFIKAMERINAERKEKYEDALEHLAEEFIKAYREEWLDEGESE